MGSLFSKKKQPTRVTQQDEAVLELKTQRDKLRQYQRKLEGGLERERQMAKELIAKGRKDRALLLLKKKRVQESLIQRSLAQIDNIEKMIGEIEFAQIEISVVECLRQGNESLKRMHSLVSVEDVERIMDETRDAVEYQHEIDSLISGQLTPTDMDDVQSELDALIAEQDGRAALDADVAMPDAPDEQLGAEEAERHKERKRRRKENERREAEAVAS